MNAFENVDKLDNFLKKKTHLYLIVSRGNRKVS